MIRSATANLALAATIAIGAISLAATAIAAQFEQAEVDQNRLIAIAAPIGNGNAHKLLILEQLNNSRLCWQENPGQVTTVEPLLLNFDFTNICNRSTDSNGYSVRTGGEDLSLRYQLTIVKRRDDLVLLAIPTRDPKAPALEIGHTQGLTNQFARIYLHPGWRLARRTFQGQPVGHLYLTTDQPLTALLARGNTLVANGGDRSVQVSPAVQANPPVQPPAGPIGYSPRPAVPAPTPNQRPTVGKPGLNPGAVVVQTLPVEPMPAPAAVPSSNGPAVVLPSVAVPQYEPVIQPVPPASSPAISPASTPASIAIPVPQPERPPLAMPAVDSPPAPLPVPSVTPPVSGFDQTPPDATAVVSGKSLPQLPKVDGGSSKNLSRFNLPAPDTNRLQVTSLWATYYYLHQAQTIAGGNPLYDRAGNHLGIELSDRDWCAAALQGSVAISDGTRSLGTFNFAGRGSTMQVNCAVFYPNLRTVNATSRSRFIRSNTPFGEGVRGNQLVPYRTVAVDPGVIPIGSVLYIPAARGVVITLPGGGQAVHDGYFYAADVGGAVQGNHIDVFIGPTTRNPFAFVRSTQSGSFQAFLVNDTQVQAQLASLHRPSSEAAQLP
ncbi:MAG TPA: DUF3747 domain-containing protein [Coleofasciculaceae cyanobacterium]